MPDVGAMAAPTVVVFPVLTARSSRAHGPAMLRVLQTAFVTASGDGLTLSALVTFLVTASGITVLDVGGPFRGFVGFAVAWLVERGDVTRRNRDAA